MQNCTLFKEILTDYITHESGSKTWKFGILLSVAKKYFCKNNHERGSVNHQAIVSINRFITYSYIWRYLSAYVFDYWTIGTFNWRLHLCGYHQFDGPVRNSGKYCNFTQVLYSRNCLFLAGSEYLKGETRSPLEICFYFKLYSLCLWFWQKHHSIQVP